VFVQINSHSSKVIIESLKDNLPLRKIELIEVNNASVQRHRENMQNFKKEFGHERVKEENK